MTRKGDTSRKGKRKTKKTVPSSSQSTGKSERIMSIICEKLLIIIGEKIGGKASDADASKKEKNVRPPDNSTSGNGQTSEETPLPREQSTGNYCIASIVYRGTAHCLW